MKPSLPVLRRRALISEKQHRIGLTKGALTGIEPAPTAVIVGCFNPLVRRGPRTPGMGEGEGGGGLRFGGLGGEGPPCPRHPWGGWGGGGDWGLRFGGLGGEGPPSPRHPYFF